MSKPVHLDIEEEVRTTMRKPPGVPGSELDPVSEVELYEKILRERKDTPFGQTQVESLLSFVVDLETERALESAEADNIVYDALGEHRILGKAKGKTPKRARFSKPGRSGDLPPGNESLPGVQRRSR